jgi:FixJ family two-component response regulator
VAQTRCLVLDVVMPGMSGPDLQGALIRVESAPPPVVFMSANGSEELFSTLVERGAVACLSKPFGEEALLAAITAAMRESDHDRK